MKEHKLSTKAKIEIVFCFINETEITKELSLNNRFEEKMISTIVGFFKEFEDAPRKNGSRRDDEKVLFKWMKKKSKKKYRTIGVEKNKIFLSMLELFFENTRETEEIRKIGPIDFVDLKTLIKFYKNNNKFPRLNAVSQKEIYLAKVRSDLIRASKSNTLDKKIASELLDISPYFLSPQAEDHKENTKKQEKTESLSLDKKICQVDPDISPLSEKIKEESCLNEDESSSFLSDPSFEDESTKSNHMRFFLQGYESNFEEECIKFYDFYKRNRRFPLKGGSEGEVEVELLAWHRRYKRKKSSEEAKTWNKYNINDLNPAMLDLSEFKELCIKRETKTLDEEETKRFNLIFSKRVHLLKKLKENEKLRNDFGNLAPFLELNFKDRDSIMIEFKVDLACASEPTS